MIVKIPKTTLPCGTELSGEYNAEYKVLHLWVEDDEDSRTVEVRCDECGAIYDLAAMDGWEVNIRKGSLPDVIKFLQRVMEIADGKAKG